MDPHLPKWLPVLAEAFLEHLEQQSRSSLAKKSADSAWLMTLPAAITNIIYTFCKIRGEKVIVRFLNVEARYLEPLLTALESAQSDSELGTHESGINKSEWTWQERYVVLLWLSQLFFAPFDLATISSVDIDDQDLPVIPGLRWPENTPGITARVLPLAISYLSVPGKERDAAKVLLVRIVMRKDMQKLGILGAMVRWALSALRPPAGESSRTPYHYIGVLSFLAGVLTASSETSDTEAYLQAVFFATHALATSTDETLEAIVSSALARKMMIKVMRSTAVALLRQPEQTMEGTEIVETVIGYLLERLADNETPVRLAASKALSIITLRLDPELASQVIEAVLESLNKNVLWLKNPLDPSAPRTRDITSVDPLEWHGLMLTLSHLLYRRSPPAQHLADIVHALILGLSFEKRSTSGSSVGSNVRDAACFGIWALARRYTTAELLAVPTKSLSVINIYPPGVSVLQILATELVVTACLDSAGNIRRGSSAALQELIGRHPDTVEKGIWVVQTVDYHSVALRSRAMSEVALAATRLAAQYGHAILESLLGWRGIGDGAASARRDAGAAFGRILEELTATDSEKIPPAQFRDSVDSILRKLKLLQPRQVEERHGLLLAFAAVLDVWPHILARLDDASTRTSQHVILDVRNELETCAKLVGRRPELVAEAACRLVVSSASIVGPALGAVPSNSPLTGPELVAGAGSERFRSMLVSYDSMLPGADQGIRDLITTTQRNMDEWLDRPEEDVITAASEASLILLVFSGAEASGHVRSRTDLIHGWAETVRQRQSFRAGRGFGFFFALASSHHVLPAAAAYGNETDGSLICRAFVERWELEQDSHIDTHVGLLQALAQSNILPHGTARLLDLLPVALDDYTTNARGDVGSLVRLEAIKASKSLYMTTQIQFSSTPSASLTAITSDVFRRILRLAAEKLDRVRAAAQVALAMVLEPQ